jgi:hypothetical protein
VQAVVRALVLFALCIASALGASSLAHAQAPPAAQLGPNGVAVAQAIVIQQQLVWQWYVAQLASNPSAPPAPTTGFPAVAPSPFRQEPVFYGSAAPAEFSAAPLASAAIPPASASAGASAGPAPVASSPPAQDAPAASAAVTAASAAPPSDSSRPPPEPAETAANEVPPVGTAALAKTTAPETTDQAIAEAPAPREPTSRQSSMTAPGSPYGMVAVFAYLALVLGYGAYAYAARRLGRRAGRGRREA